MIPIVIWGAAGRMGGCLLRKIADDKEWDLKGAVDREDHPALGKPISFVHDIPQIKTFLEKSPGSVDSKGVVVDFSLPGGTAAAAVWAIKHRWALVSGTTGLATEDIETLSKAERVIPVLTASNFSIGIQLMIKLCALTAKTLPSSFQCAILDVHHAAKKDRPSGTARTLADAVNKEKPSLPTDITSLRVGRIIGEHEVRFTNEDEDVILIHQAHSRDVFAAGALTAARWLIKQPPGRYNMADVLGISDK